MIYFFFDTLSFQLLRVCFSKEDYSKFIDSDSYSFLVSNLGSDLVCYSVSQKNLFKFLKNDSLN